MKPCVVCVVCTDVDEPVAKTEKKADSRRERAQKAEKRGDAEEDGDSSEGLCKAQSWRCWDGEEPAQNRHKGK